MNASRLREMLELLQKSESKFGIQNLLQEIDAALQNMANQPNQPQYQQNYLDVMQRLNSALHQMRATFTPAQIKHFEEIGADRYYSDDFAALISNWVQENAATPVAAQQKIQTLLSERSTFNSHATQTLNALQSFGIQADSLGQGEAEIGFLIPRDLFHNHLDDLIDELGTIKNIIRFFSEIATGSPEPIEVHEISTSNPIFFFGLDPQTIALIGGAVTWALHTWKQLEDIRKVRAETAKLASFNAEEIEKIFGSKIKETVSAEVEEHTKKLLAHMDEKNGRTNELSNGVEWALNSLLSRVERGMTVEIRLLPPPVPTTPETGEAAERREAFENLQQIVPQLLFPNAVGEPVLKLPPATPPKRAD